LLNEIGRADVALEQVVADRDRLDAGLAAGLELAPDDVEEALDDERDRCIDERRAGVKRQPAR